MRRPPEKASELADAAMLNEHQLRHFEVFLSQLETALSQIVDLSSSSSADDENNLIVYKRDLPDDFSSKARPAIVAIKEQAGLLARSLRIKAQFRSRRRAIKAIVTAELVRLDDSYARKLRGYGAVNTRVEKQIDPILDTIRPSLLAVLQACEGASPISEGAG